MKSFRRKSFAKISRKTLCLIMSISLCLMMVPHALYANKAYADSVPNADDSQVQPEIVKADNDMNGFGSFTYNVKDASKNSKVYTNNDLLNLLGAKVETNDSVQKSADAEIKRVLLENNINLKNNVLPFAEEGAKTELTKISSVASTNAALNISPVVEEQVVDGQTVQVVNKWNFTTQNAAADNVNFPIIVTAANSTYKAVYKASIISNKVISEQVIPVNSNIATGSVKVQPASYTDKTQIYIVVDLQVKNLVNTQNNINVNVKKVNNGKIFKNDSVVLNSIEYNISSGKMELSLDNLLTESAKEQGVEISVGEKDPKLNIQEEKDAQGKLTGYSVKASNLSIMPLSVKLTSGDETCTIVVNNVVPQKVTNVQPILDKLSAGFDMREKGDQEVKIKNDLNNINVIAEDGTNLIVTPAVDMQIIKGTYPDLNSASDTYISLEEKALALIQGGSVTTNYVLDFGKFEFGAWVKALVISSDTSESSPVILSDGDGTQKTFSDWFTVNDDVNGLIKLQAKDKISTVCNLVTNSQNYEFSESCNPVPADTLSGQSIRISVLIKDADGVITKFETKDNEGLNLDTTIPVYNKYSLEKNDDWAIVDGNVFDIINKWILGLFSNNEITVQIFITSVSGIKEIYVTNNPNPDEQNDNYWTKKLSDGDITFDTTNNCYCIKFSENTEEDFGDWHIMLENEASTWTDWESFITESSEHIQKIIIDKNPPTCEIDTNIKPISKELEPKPEDFDIYSDATNFDIKITDPYFKYTRHEKQDEVLMTIDKIGDPFTEDPKQASLDIKYGDFVHVKNTDIWYIHKNLGLDLDSGIEEVKYEFKVYDNVRNLLGKDATPFGEIDINNLKAWDTKTFYVSKLQAKASIKWTTNNHKEYNNTVQKAKLIIEGWNGKIEDLPKSSIIEYTLNNIKKSVVVKESRWQQTIGVNHSYSIDLSFGNDTSGPGEDNGWWIFQSIDWHDILNRQINTENIKDDPDKGIYDKSFVFDNVAPKISVEYFDWGNDKGLADNSHSQGSREKGDLVKYFADVSNPSVKVKVDEQYSWNEKDTNAVVKLNNDNLNTISIDDGTIGVNDKWTDNGTEHRKDITFNGGKLGGRPDGRYNFTIDGLEDLAGNKCEFDVEKDRKDGEISTDSEGHKKFTSDTFDFDTKAPKIDIDWGYDKPVYHGKYYNQARTAKVTIKERNWLNPAASEGNSAKINATIDGNRIVDENANWQESGQYEHSITIPYSGQGDCALNLNCGDMITKLYTEQQGLHHSDNGAPDFVQDWTAPTINVNWDNNNVVNNMYYANARTATITIDERYFSDATNPPEIVVHPISYPGNDGVTGSYNLDGAWSNDGNLHTKTLSFPNEGAFAVEVVGNDLAMNNLNPYTQSKFVLDWTKPVINISGVENRQAYGDVAQPNVAVNDTNISDATNVNVESLGITKAMPYNGSPSTTPTTYTCTYENPEKIPDNDGVFRISVNAQDMAGNTDQQELVWSVNRFGSTYVIGADTEPMVNNYVNNDSVKDVVVTEINPSGLESSNIDLSKGTYTQTLKEGDEYTTESKGGGDSWFEQTYTVKKDTFNEDGKYSLNFYSKDKAGNTSDNTMDNRNQDRTASANVQFVLDNIKPSCNFENLDNPEYYESSHDASSLFEDNTKKFKEAKIEVDGVETYVSGDDLENNDYKIDFNIKDSSKPHTINAYATDKAGNEMEYCSKSVVVTNNPFLYWFYNTPLFIGTLVALALIIAAVVYFIYRKKKLNEE